MEILVQIGILFGVCLLGESISSLLPVTVPSSVIGMLLLLLLLCLGILQTRHIEKLGDFLLKNMAFFFIPSGVGILDYYSVVSGSIFKLLLICLLTTILTFAATAKTVEAVINIQERRREQKA